MSRRHAEKAKHTSFSLNQVLASGLKFHREAIDPNVKDALKSLTQLEPSKVPTASMKSVTESEEAAVRTAIDTGDLFLFSTGSKKVVALAFAASINQLLVSYGVMDPQEAANFLDAAKKAARLIDDIGLFKDLEDLDDVQEDETAAAQTAAAPSERFNDINLSATKTSTAFSSFSPSSIGAEFDRQNDFGQRVREEFRKPSNLRLLGAYTASLATLTLAVSDHNIVEILESISTILAPLRDLLTIFFAGSQVWAQFALGSKFLPQMKNWFDSISGEYDVEFTWTQSFILWWVGFNSYQQYSRQELVEIAAKATAIAHIFAKQMAGALNFERLDAQQAQAEILQDETKPWNNFFETNWTRMVTEPDMYRFTIYIFSIMLTIATRMTVFSVESTQKFIKLNSEETAKNWASEIDERIDTIDDDNFKDRLRQQLQDAKETWIKNSKNATTEKTVKKYARRVATAFGTPVRNVLRLSKTLLVSTSVTTEMVRFTSLLTRGIAGYYWKKQVRENVNSINLSIGQFRAVITAMDNANVNPLPQGGGGGGLARCGRGGGGGRGAHSAYPYPYPLP